MERDQDEVAFPKELVSKLLHEHLKNEKMRVSADALLLLAELLKVFVREAAARTARQALVEDITVGDVEQVEKILPQLVRSLLVIPVHFIVTTLPTTKEVAKAQNLFLAAPGFLGLRKISERLVPQEAQVPHPLLYNKLLYTHNMYIQQCV
uniref:Centromere protein X n=1 Tax=Xenopus tropicalis TaxID=8364 RepID=A0A6I8SJP4_XENTR